MKLSMAFLIYETDTNKYSKALDQAAKTQVRNAARIFLKVVRRLIPVRTGFVSGAFGNLADVLDLRTQDVEVRTEKIRLKNKRTAKLDISKNFGKIVKNIHTIGQTEPFGTTFRDVEGNKIKNPPKPGNVKQLQFSGKDLRKAAKVEMLGKNKRNKSIFELGGKGKTRSGLGIPIEYYTGGGGKTLKTSQSGKRFATQPGQIFQQSLSIYMFNYRVLIDYFNINDFLGNKRNPGSPWHATETGMAMALKFLKDEGFKALPNIQTLMVEKVLAVEDTSITETKVTSTLTAKGNAIEEIDSSFLYEIPTVDTPFTVGGGDAKDRFEGSLGFDPHSLRVEASSIGDKTRRTFRGKLKSDSNRRILKEYKERVAKGEKPEAVRKDIKRRFSKASKDRQYKFTKGSGLPPGGKPPA